jgi:hypothetical protein
MIRAEREGERLVHHRYPVTQSARLPVLASVASLTCGRRSGKQQERVTSAFEGENR